ncbi:unnamed protein product [Ilex paraguariensis]|uniref:Uncharacterized protein n=1 Tax=Ilex paraguariensis TaxID=185542 RepID=A0ABC8TCR9_9AQUA
MQCQFTMDCLRIHCLGVLVQSCPCNSFSDTNLGFKTWDGILLFSSPLHSICVCVSERTHAGNASTMGYDTFDYPIRSHDFAPSYSKQWPCYNARNPSLQNLPRIIQVAYVGHIVCLIGDHGTPESIKTNKRTKPEYTIRIGPGANSFVIIADFS